MSTDEKRPGWSASNETERLDAAMGISDAHRIVILHMIRAISQGLSGEEAYEKIAAGLEADSNARRPGVQGDAMHGELHFLTSIFRGKPSQEGEAIPSLK